MTRFRFSQAVATVAAGLALAACGGVTNTDTGAVATATGPSAAADPATTTDCTQATRNPAKVVCLADAFKATLSSSQIASLQLAYTQANATTWSNLPVSIAPRVGLRFDALSATQRAAALNLAKAALGAAGYATFNSIRAADAYLAANGGNSGGGPGGGGGLSYGDTLYFVSILGTPSTTGAWMLKFDGHHFAVNLHYNGTQAPTATPHFIGTEPQAFTLNGVTYAPLQQRKVYLYQMINSLDATQAPAAQLSQAFNDVLLGPGQDGKFPTRQGLAYSSLTSAQQALVRQAIAEWVNIQPSNEAGTTLAAYTSDAALANTSIAWSGSRDSTVSGSYIRIDGPRVWIEFACQTGIVFRNQIHFHTIWRDRQYDYGGDFTF